LGLSSYDAGIVTSSRELVRYFEEATQLGASAKALANLLAGEVSRLANEKGTWLGSRLLPVHLADVVRELQAARISATAAKQLIGLAWESGERIADLIELEGLAQVSDTRALEAWLDEVIAQSPGQWSEFQSGKDKLIGFFTGQVMKKSGGKANPALIQELIRKKVGS
jgi:aspartyl-tRNA(Asn)/glutamyl-tRNA(Gln) amidotransferase subunit B